MKKISIVLIILFSPFATTLRAAPVQWKIEDGGNGHYYDAVIASNMSWYEAKSDAELRGGYLATITSAEENLFIENNFLISPSANNYFIGGLQQPFPNGNWQWITGNEEWNYQNWASWPLGQEPSGDGEALMIYSYWDAYESRHGKWNDMPGTLAEGFGSYIMEVPEPATILLLTLGGLALRRRKQN